jgi:hypothetical protein
VRDLMRRLAELEPGELPVISAYLDRLAEAAANQHALLWHVLCRGGALWRGGQRSGLVE